MVKDEVSGLTTLELMQRLAPLLPEGSFEQAQLLGVIKGLSTAGFSGQFGKGKAWEAGGEGRARQVLRAILPKLSQQLPDNPLVVEPAKRFNPPRAKG
jgi:hypothetical protein